MKVLKLVISAAEAAEVVEKVSRHYLRENGFVSQHDAHLALASREELTFLLNETNQIIEELMHSFDIGLSPYPHELVAAVKRLHSLISTALVDVLGDCTGLTYYIHRFRMLDIMGTLEVELSSPS